MKVLVSNVKQPLIFEEQKDGWFVNAMNNLAISPDKTTCVTHLWYADYICDPPTHDFEIIEGT